jgi:hypothetical protein
MANSDIIAVVIINVELTWSGLAALLVTNLTSAELLTTLCTLLTLREFSLWQSEELAIRA